MAPAATTRRTWSASARAAVSTVALVAADMPVACTAATMSLMPPLMKTTSFLPSVVRASRASTWAVTLGALVPLLVSGVATRALPWA